VAATYQIIFKNLDISFGHTIKTTNLCGKDKVRINNKKVTFEDTRPFLGQSKGYILLYGFKE